MLRKDSQKLWTARLLVTLVFAANLSAAIPFILSPDRYAPGFELSGTPGGIMVRSMGILFLMWNSTFPPVILHPDRYRVLFSVILVQQILGLAGEMAMWVSLPAAHSLLRSTGTRFILFDGFGLLALGLAFLISRKVDIRPEE